MIRSNQVKIFLVFLFFLAGISHISTAQTPATEIGVVVMHGKGGSPLKLVAELASLLAKRGYLVENLEMPWSGARNYDVDVDTAEMEVGSALGRLRSRGARKVFVAGHSQGGLFALYFGGRQVADGIIAIAPGGNVGNSVFREKLGAAVDLARKLIAGGKGDEKTDFSDFENARNTYTIVTTPALYLTWFDPEGAMNQTMAIQKINPLVPVLFIVPLGDFPGLRKVKDQFFSLLPKNPFTKLYEPDSNHVKAPSASYDEIVRWTFEVAGGR